MDNKNKPLFEPSKAAQAVMTLKFEMDNIEEGIKMQMHMCRVQYLALLEQGFTKEQALKITIEQPKY